MDMEEIKQLAESIEYVDLGLSVKWANCNLGASTPEETGHRFSFAEKSTIDYVNLPTKEQCEELINNCTWKWRGGKNKGVYVTGKNGNSIFLPAVGEEYSDGSRQAEGEAGSYWSSSLQGTDGKYAYYISYCYKFDFLKMKFTMSKGVYFTNVNLRNLVIRPVK